MIWTGNIPVIPIMSYGGFLVCIVRSIYYNILCDFYIVNSTFAFKKKKVFIKKQDIWFHMVWEVNLSNKLRSWMLQYKSLWWYEGNICLLVDEIFPTCHSLNVIPYLCFQAISEWPKNSHLDSHFLKRRQFLWGYIAH